MCERIKINQYETQINNERRKTIKIEWRDKIFVRDSDKCDNLEIIDPYVQLH